MMNDVATDIQKRANKQGVSMTYLCAEAGVSRTWFELFKKRVPKSVGAFIRIDSVLKKLEEEN